MTLMKSKKEAMKLNPCIESDRLTVAVVTFHDQNDVMCNDRLEHVHIRLLYIIEN